MADTKTISMLQLRENLSGYLSEAAAGRHFTITRFGSPLAALGPITTATMAVAPAAGLITSDAHPDAQRVPRPKSHPIEDPS